MEESLARIFERVVRCHRDFGPNLRMLTLAIVEHAGWVTTTLMS